MLGKYLVMLVVAYISALFLTGCANWQGMEFRVGLGNYNGAKETRTYERTEDKK